MPQVKAVRIVSFPKTEPTADNFAVSLVDLPEASEGQVVVKTLYLSVDPYMRGRMRETAPAGYYAATWQKDAVPEGFGVGRIVTSKNSAFAPGDVVGGGVFPWQEHFVSNGQGLHKLQHDGRMPLTAYLCVLGMPGMTAYFGLLDICDPKSGETVVVSGAAGAVGSAVGQIAKIRGCRVVGIAGSDDKLAWLKSIGFDDVINYKTADVPKALHVACPTGVDCYFDNVGGELADTVISQMNVRGRVAFCGAISSYNKTPGSDVGVRQYGNIVSRGLKLQGFIISRDYGNRVMEGMKHMGEWYAAGHLKQEDTILQGIDNMGKALEELFQGKNTGKMIVKISSE